MALANPRAVYDLLFRWAAEALREVAANPEQLGARTGVLMVLHTWGQALHLHPHVHCVVTGGGLSEARTWWVGSRPDFFLPVRVLSRVFRGKFLAGLRAPIPAANWLDGPVRRGRGGRVRAPVLGRRSYRLGGVRQASFWRPEVVLKYLARYTHRVAISEFACSTLRTAWSASATRTTRMAPKR